MTCAGEQQKRRWAGSGGWQRGRQRGALPAKVQSHPTRAGPVTLNKSQLTIRWLPDNLSGMQQIKGNPGIQISGSGSGRHVARLRSCDVARARTGERSEPTRMPPARFLTDVAHRAPSTAASPQVTAASRRAGHGHRQPNERSPGGSIERACLSTRRFNRKCVLKFCT